MIGAHLNTARTQDNDEGNLIFFLLMMINVLLKATMTLVTIMIVTMSVLGQLVVYQYSYIFLNMLKIVYSILY